MKFRLFFATFFMAFCVVAQSVKSPSEFLGHELGTNFSRHHQVVDYYKYLASELPEIIKIKSYGTTNEGRELLVAFVSTPKNMNNLESIRKEHIRSTTEGNIPEKALVWLSYNVHGNESVSTEASMQTIYEVVTNKKDWLENTVVIFDPCINPDGRDRYVNWYNSFKNTPYNVDVNSKEHHETWLSGRSNHYMFDLNRDWAWVTQKESKQRLTLYNEWLPHIHVDFHEQGINNPYYFAPAAEPMHEVITQWQRDFQVSIGKNHAKYFDEKGWFYFTKEVFDLLYPSYGDTYPIYNGAIGMTYEQGGSGRAGLGVKIANGDTLTLKDRIAHHYTTGLSTIEMASNNASKLIAEFDKFYNNKDFKYKSYVLSGNTDKLHALTELLDAHKISYGYTSYNARGYEYDSGKSGSLDGNDSKLVISTDQPKANLVKVLFEPKTKLSDSLTYDITAWSLPYAYGLNAVASENLVSANAEAPVYSKAVISNDAYAYVTDWNSMDDARFLTGLIKKGVRVRYAQENFEVSGKSFDRGSLIITKGDNTHLKNLNSILNNLATAHRKTLTTTSTGFVDSGKDFGSSSVNMISDVKVAALSGGSVSTLNFGEVWHFFEQQLHYPLTVLDDDYFDRVDLSEYDVLILPESNNIKKEQLSKIKTWVRSGGKLIAIGRTLSSLDSDEDFGLSKQENEGEKQDSIQKPEPYASSSREYIKNMITGAIYKAKVDVTHPLAYGYQDTYYTLKLSGNAYSYLKNGNAVYIADTSEPLAGFAGSNAKKLQANSLIFGTESMGSGTVVYLVDNPLFRAFWENGKLFFVNALFMME
ncbi:M14 family metallopeptidase [Galbibacter sp. EGI 63066]|uniref:M14 family metallopeptidase n=1 Tax=Galbibacter sp. EGI 63066 TaxID=2993559 RepID=UPI002248FD3F|nr:M14 family metallopeptidase [Galbibacter sp. EGI 63066]MCX2678419.1 M14 family metallopeptidase [Galbibacter sp. EGI 63066]